MGALFPADGFEPVVIGPDDLLGALPAGVRRVGLGAWEGGGSEPLERAGHFTGRAVVEAVDLWKAGAIDAIVTAPGDKRALNAAGFRVPGHTELLRDLTGTPRVAMMLASDRLRVVLATTHLALRDVPAAVTPAAIIEAATITRAGLHDWFGIAEPRIALCALNPHAGDGRRFGDEDDTILAPAARAAGIAGPFSADTVFVRAMQDEFDAVIAPYHDVGMTAIKVASFGHTVNVTLGLPFPRTSPDHGTAMGIAGKGVARADSMIAAMMECARIVTAVDGRGQGQRRVESVP